MAGPFWPGPATHYPTYSPTDEYGDIDYGGLPSESAFSLMHCATTWFTYDTQSDDTADREELLVPRPHP
jgi:hypothetical protein